MPHSELAFLWQLFYPEEDALKLAVWEKGHVAPGLDCAIWRHDDFGYFIRYDDYGNRSSPWGWEKDHRVATARGGEDHPANLRPLHWSVNASLGGLLGALLQRT